MSPKLLFVHKTTNIYLDADRS